MKKNLIKLYKKFTRKTVLGALSLAIALWVFTSLNEMYSVKVGVPFELNLPSNRALEAELPKKITVETRGSGWNLFNLLFFNTEKKCYVDLSGTKIIDSNYQVSRSQLLTGVKSFEEVQSVNVYPENIDVKTGKNVTIKVPVEDRINIKTNPNFVVVDNVKFIPDSISITGNHKIISKIDKWYTKNETLDDVKTDLEGQIELSDSLEGIIEINPKTIDYSANVQLLADMEYEQIQIDIIGGKIPKNFQIYPMYFNVTVSGGIQVLSKLRRQEILISIDLSDILNSETGVIKPVVQLPDNITLKQIYPDKIYIFKRDKINNLNQISLY